MNEAMRAAQTKLVKLLEADQLTPACTFACAAIIRLPVELNRATPGSLPRTAIVFDSPA
jgi:hypothetical protein